MHCKKITCRTSDLHKIKALYKEAFPKEERIPFYLLLLRSKASWIDFLAYYEEEQLCAIACMMSSQQITSIMYLAVHPSLRCQGYGAKILARIQAQYANHTLVLEIEAIDQAASNYEQQLRRKAFYLRQNFTSSGYGVTMYRVQYEVLQCNGDFAAWEWEKLTNRLAFNIKRFSLYNIE